MGKVLRIVSLLLCIYFVIINADTEYEKDENVYILTDSNFDSFLSENPTALIEFYAPW